MRLKGITENGFQRLALHFKRVGLNDAVKKVVESLDFSEALRLAQEIAPSGTLGIRALSDDEFYKIGDTARESYDWDFENDMSSYETEDPKSLGGSCAIYIGSVSDFEDAEELKEAILNSQSDYGRGNYALLVTQGGAEMLDASDPGEAIMSDAIVVALFS